MFVSGSGAEKARFLPMVYFYLFLETLAEGRSKVRDAKEEGVLVVGAEFGTCST